MIKPGRHAIVQKVGGEHIRVCKLTKKQWILIEKLRFQVDGAFDEPFGLFEVSAGNIKRACAEALVNADGIGDIELQNTEVYKAEICDSASCIASATSADEETCDPAQSRQKLTQQEISEMKDTGVPASELVAKLVDGSKSFSERTVFSQNKYIRRKTKKHSDRVLILKPTIRLIAESYYKKDAERVANLRIDTLSHMLALSGVRSGLQCFVFEQCLGLLTAAVIDRLGGCGACIHLHRGQIAQAIPCVDSMDFEEQIYSTFLPLSISTLLRGSVEENVEEKAEEIASEAQLDAAVLSRRAERLAREKVAWEIMNSKQIDCLLIAVRGVDPIDVLQRVWDNLRLASTVVVYSPVAEPVYRTYEWLKSKSAVHVQVNDSFFRSYQVLPDRTHPLMQQLIAGGTLLSAVKVASSV